MNLYVECCMFSRNLAEYEHQSTHFSRPARNSTSSLNGVDVFRRTINYFVGVAQRLHIIINTFCHNILKSKMTRREKEICCLRFAAPIRKTYVYAKHVVALSPLC